MPKAADAIVQALKEGDRHKLFIVVTSEAGRVRPDDAEMLRKARTLKVYTTP